MVLNSQRPGCCCGLKVGGLFRSSFVSQLHYHGDILIPCSCCRNPKRFLCESFPSHSCYNAPMDLHPMVSKLTNYQFSRNLEPPKTKFRPKTQFPTATSHRFDDISIFRGKLLQISNFIIVFFPFGGIRAELREIPRRYVAGLGGFHDLGLRQAAAEVRLHHLALRK